MKDSINRKHNKRSAMAAPSDDRNGVVVNRAIDSTRGIPNRLVEERCIARWQIHAKSEERRFTTATSTLVRPNTGFL